jgi:hypothetical protein
MAGSIGCMNAHKIYYGKDKGQCNRPARNRGLCLGCYNLLAAKIRAGVTTWEEQERLGNCAPKHKRAWEYPT